MTEQKTLFGASPSPATGKVGPGPGSRLCPACGGYFRPQNTMEGYQQYCSTQCFQDCQDITQDRWGRTPEQAARDEALERVAREEFMREGLKFIGSLGHGTEATGEEIRLRCEARGIEPHHHNAWGSLIMAALRKGLLRHTGRYAPMTVKRSHARRTPVYEVL